MLEFNKNAKNERMCHFLDHLMQISMHYYALVAL